MKANEVRVGNWINKFSNELIDGVPESRIVTPVKVDTNHITLLAMAPKWNAGAYEPIPLTEEILQKNGIEYTGGAFAWKFSPVGQTIIVECKYVHQLQNLYFALTGEELNIEL